MTETVTEPQAPPEETTPSPASPTAAETSSAKQVDHTPGGVPVVPLSLTGANATASILATAALAGGPVAAAVVMTGAVALSAVATRKRGKTAKGKTTTTSKSAPAGARTSGGRGLLGRVPTQPRTAPRAGGGGGSRKSAGQSRHRAGGPAGVGGSGSHRAKGGTSSARQRAVQAAGRLAGGRAGQVRELRASTRAQSPTRAASRTGTVQARRQVADNRRSAKAAERAASAQAKPRGLAARTLAKGMGKAATVRDKAVAGARSIRDRSAGRAVASGRDGIRQAAHRKRVEQLKAPARKAARKALRRSAARFHARRALAGALGAAAGVLGMVTTPLGRKLRMPSLMHPGRRLYRALVNRARTAREARDTEIRAQLEQDEQAAEQAAAAEQNDDEQHINDRVERPAGHVPAPPTSEGAVHVSTVSGFRFEEYAAEMEQAAQSYDPDGAMEILAMIEGLPQALASVANVMQILGERSDSEFPLEKAVAETFRDCFGAVMAAVSVAEEMGPIFRQQHEQDIARHEDPRNGTDAEKGWNV
ncbi:hypothetical protein [Streptomyces sp. NPDC090036]|uniref:hypothetical protein n=1 Tax=Streptomyces sp. NPDC090036 TaxID=3365926 RepID=UPI003810D2AD